MIKRTLLFENPAYLSLKLQQLVVQKPGDEDNRTIPIEDIGVIILDNKQITITQALMGALLENNCAIITCDNHHLPVGLFLPLSGNTIQNERFRAQLDSSLPLRKQLWQQTIQQKIRNQSAVLDFVTQDHHENMLIWANEVRSGDPDNIEARAAAYYWKCFFPKELCFTRNPDEEGINGLFNYAYSILRSIVARSLVASGLLPTLGIHHHNRYNAYCLADDIMEPYRPFADKLVYQIVQTQDISSLNSDIKRRLLSIPVLDVMINGKKSPLMLAATTTTASLVKCYKGEIKKVLYPEMQ